MPHAHILDRPIWTALTTRQERLAEINGPARRYPADIAPFADLADFSPASFAALHALMRADQPAVLFTPDPVVQTLDQAKGVIPGDTAPFVNHFKTSVALANQIVRVPSIHLCIARELRGKSELTYPHEGADHTVEFPL